MAQKIISWLAIALILSLGFGQLLRFEWGSATVYTHDILTLSILVLSLPALRQGGLRRIRIPLGLKVFAVGLAIGWCRAFMLFPLEDLNTSLLYTLRLLAYLSAYLALRSRKVTIPKSVFLLAGIVTLIIGYIQYFVMPDMRLFQYLGWDDHLNRITLPHFDPTFTGVMLALATISLVPVRSIHGVAYILFTTLALLLTYARSVWLALAVTALAFVKSRGLLIIAIVVLLLAMQFLPKRFGEGTNFLRTYSIESRYVHDRTVIKELRWNLVTGIGMNTIPRLKLAESEYRVHATGLNNSYLYLLATTGILGLVGWGMFMCVLYRQSNYKPVIVFILIASLFNNVMFYPFALLWILLVDLCSNKASN